MFLRPLTQQILSHECYEPRRVRDIRNSEVNPTFLPVQRRNKARIRQLQHSEGTGDSTGAAEGTAEGAFGRFLQSVMPRVGERG